MKAITLHENDIFKHNNQNYLSLFVAYLTLTSLLSVCGCIQSEQLTT